MHLAPRILVTIAVGLTLLQHIAGLHNAGGCLFARPPRILGGHGTAPGIWTGKRGGGAWAFGDRIMRLRGGESEGVISLMDRLRALSLAQQNAVSVLAICFGIFGSVELQGKLRHRLPKSLSRKLTHITVGCTLLAGMALLPIGHSCSGKLGICVFIYLFMMGFSIAAYIPDEDLRKLPAFIRVRIERLIDLCRGGERIELMGGTFLYCAVVAIVVATQGTSPLAVIALSGLFLGDGLADPIGRWLGGTPSMQYRVGWFGQKSYPGSVACFLATVIGSLLWARLFHSVGHYGPDFDEAIFVRCSVMCAAASTIAEAMSPPMVDNVVMIVAAVTVGLVLKEGGYAPFLMHSRL